MMKVVTSECILVVPFQSRFNESLFIAHVRCKNFDSSFQIRRTELDNLNIKLRIFDIYQLNVRVCQEMVSCFSIGITKSNADYLKVVFERLSSTITIRNIHSAALFYWYVACQIVNCILKHLCSTVTLSERIWSFWSARVILQ